MRRFGFVLLLLLAPGLARADERIFDYEVEIDVRPDASLEIVERIVVRAEGVDIRRGVYRDFPTRYRDRAGNNVVVDLEVLGVERNGVPEPWFTERQWNGVRINTGNDDFLPVPAEYEFTLRYRTTRQIGFFSDHDELYFNAIPHGWAFPIDAGRVTVRLPAPAPIEDLAVEGYSGPQGAQGRDFEARITGPGVAEWRLTRALAPRAGLTIVLGFPKGMLPEPTRGQRLGWLLRDNRGVLVALAGLALLVLYCGRRWRQVGRDPRQGVIIARYEPPAGQTPAGLRFMRRMGYDTRCFSADVLALAVAGAVSIHREKKLLRKDEWRLERGAAPGSLDPAQQGLLARLFPGGRTRLDLRNTNASTVQGAQKAHQAELARRFEPEMFNRNRRSAALAVLIAVAAGALAFLVSGGGGIALIFGVCALMLLVVVMFTRLVRAPTPAGRMLLDEIEGLKLYLSVAERDELKQMEGPDAPPRLDAQRYEQLLPYAVALEVEDAWTKKFTLAVGAAAAAAAASSIAWYHGGGSSDLGGLSRAVGQSLSSTIASSSTPPGSSSGFGGGSSGGGGGGGGGGGR